MTTYNQRRHLNVSPHKLWCRSESASRECYNDWTGTL